MKGDSGKTESVWRQTKPSSFHSVLREDTAADVCIVGAGVAGITSAYLLAREGKSVILIDDGPVLGGETCRTTAHLSNALDDRYYELERLHGAQGARLAAESHSAAIRKIEALAAEEKIDCEFASVSGYLFMPKGHSTKVLEVELEAARRAGVPEIEMLPRAPLEFFDTGPALRFGKQGQIHPLKYLEGLAAAVQRDGGKIFTRSHVNGVEDGKEVKVETTDGKVVKAKACIVAANTPFNDWVVMHTKQMAYRTYVIGARIPRGSVPKMLLWDEPRPYHYIRDLPQSYHYVRVHSPQDESNQAEHDFLIIGGEDHKTGQANDSEARYRRLETWARERFPMMETIEYRWSGQVIEPVDGVAYLGRNPKNKNVYIATGDSGMGMTHGTIAGMLLTDLICGRGNEWEKLYDPSRITLKAA